MIFFWAFIVIIGFLSLVLPWWSKFNWLLVGVLIVVAVVTGSFLVSVHLEEIVGYFWPSNAFASAEQLIADEASTGFFWRDTLMRFGGEISAGYMSFLLCLSLLSQQFLAKLSAKGL